MNPFEIGVYFIAVVGVFGITLIPCRSGKKLLAWRGLWGASVAGKLLLLVIALTAAFACWADFYLVSEIFHCLSGQRCGPKMLSGLMLLDSIGIWYLMLEVALLLFSLIAHHLLVAQPNNSSKPTPLRGEA